uniref:protein MEI2-like 5 n=1 Tax=Erigeron canadensis TaxID=72917 RepID=UPI001CB8E016|nr:protein MEI2-like 5 [Erigeron canadensis]XP_043615212.1 protein MEI2-like 5 [Erigeron canadensis]
MQVAVKDQRDRYRPDFSLKEHVGKSILKADKQVTCLEDNGSIICTSQTKTIESLLPDEEDLFSGALAELGFTAIDNNDDEDFDLFSSSGGMELEGNSNIYSQQWTSVTAEGLNSDQSSSDCLISREQPSRTLLVKNVDNRVEDSELMRLFEQHGDIQSLYTTCRYQGFVIISYYDTRAATLALSALQNKPLQNEKLHIQYLNPKDGTSGQYIDQSSIEVFGCDSSVSNIKLHQIFANFGEIEEICGTTHHRHIKYYDIRAAEAAISGLNSGNLLQDSKLKLSYPARTKSLVQQVTHELVQGQFSSCQSPSGNSLPQVVNSCMIDGYIYGVQSPSEMAINANCCITNSLPSPVGMSSIYNQFVHKPHYPTNQAKLHSNCPSFHPQSLPISCKGFVNNGIITYDPLNLAAVGVTTETDDKHYHMLGAYALPMEHMFVGSPKITRSGLGGCHHALSCSNSFQNHHLNHAMWSRSPPFDDGVCAPSTPSLPVSHKSPKRDTVAASPLSFGRPRGRARRVSHGRHETVSCHTDEKKYELDIERVLRGEDCRTTLMIKNIPNKYSSAMLLAAINEHNQGTYDFIYLPLDFKNKCNMGYAFINMTDPLQIVRFHKSINGRKWEKFHSGKVACLAYARIQGKAALIAHFQESSLMNEDKCCHPILFTTDGPNAGSQEPFPLGPNIPSRRHKNKCNMAEVYENQEMSYHIKNSI